MNNPAAETIGIGLVVALGIGLLIGLDRERTKGSGIGSGPAGVRTFALLGLAGALADMVGTSGILIVGLFVTLAIVASYRQTRANDPGLTTEMAMLVTFLLGILAMRLPSLAAGLGVIVAILLASKATLHRFIRQLLSEQELHDVLLLTAAAFVVLPLLPDRTIDPWQALNPWKLWLLAVAVMTVSSVGYVALRAFGARFGLAIAGLAGGFVSSTATIAAMGDRAKASPDAAAAAASGGLMSNVATIVQLAVVIGALSPLLLRQTALPLVAAGVVASAAAALSSWRSFGSSIDAGALAGKRPFEPALALQYVAVISVVMLLAAIVRDWLGDASLPWVLAASGIVDVHAAAASAAQLVAAGHFDSERASTGVLAALVSNSLLKCAVALARGGTAYALRLVPGVAAMVIAFAVTMAMS